MLARALDFQGNTRDRRSMRRGRLVLPRRERSCGVRGPIRRAAPILVALAIAGGSMGWAGCGEDEVDNARDEADKALEEGRERLDEATKEGEEALEETRKKGNEAIDEAEKRLDDAKVGKEAEKKLDEAKDKADEAIDDAERELEGSGY
jgi:F0F1-type ATP synthase membrane subunit b/b'